MMKHMLTYVAGFSLPSCNAILGKQEQRLMLIDNTTLQVRVTADFECGEIACCIVIGAEAYLYSLTKIFEVRSSMAA